MIDTITDFRVIIAGLDELSEELISSVSHVVSLVDPGTVLPASLESIIGANRLRIDVHDAFAEDRDKVAPSPATIENLIGYANKFEVSDLSQLLVHCHMGRSRSPAAAAIILVALGCSPVSVFHKIYMSRKPIWPNWSMVELGDQALGCNKELMCACEEIYNRTRLEFPKWVEDPNPENL